MHCANCKEKITSLVDVHICQPIDKWTSITYPTLTDDENELIRKARRDGYGVFYPVGKQDEATLRGAKEFLEFNKNKPLNAKNS